MAEGGWDATIEEWVVSEGYCYAAALAQCEDGAFYAAAPAADEAGWAFVFKDEHEETVLQEDGVTEKKMAINEAKGIKHVFDTKGKKPEGGLWIGGIKHNITQFQPEFESGDYTFAILLAQAPKKGVVMASTGSQIIAGFYSEEKGQSAPNCNKTVVAFAEYLKGIGY